jgi:hypothetical protein
VAAPQSRPWLWIAVGSVGFCGLVTASVLFLMSLGGSRNRDQVAQSAGTAPPSATAQKEPEKDDPVRSDPGPNDPVHHDPVPNDPAANNPVGKEPPKNDPPVRDPVRPRTALPAEYTELARALSNVYRADASGPDPAAGKPQTTDLVGVIKRLEGAQHPAVRAAVPRLEAGRVDAVKAVEDVKASADSARRNLEETLEAADRGEYTQKVERSWESVDTSGQVRTIHSTETVDNSGMPLFGAALLNGWVQAHAPEQMRKRAAAAMEVARLETWDTLVPKLPEIYGDCPAGSGLVRFRISAPDAASNRPPEFAVTNASRHTLTDVTLVVDLLHFSTAPDPTVFQVYFIPQWKAGQELRLPAACVRNRRCEEYTKGRPTIANPDLDSRDAPTNFVRNPWLAGLGGVVAVRAGLWAAEAQQPVQSFPFPEQALAGARWELGVATRLASSSLSRQAYFKNLPPNAKPTLPPDDWEARAARRVLTFVPADSDLARQARLLLEDPVALFRQQTTTKGDLLLRMTEPGAVLVGEWKFEVKGFGIGVPANVQQAASRRQDKTGRIALRIDSRKDDGTVTATLYDPDQPTRKRQLTGGQYIKEFARLSFLGVRAGRGPAFVPEHLDVLTSPSNLFFDFSETEVTGTSPGYPFPSCYTIRLTLKPDPKVLANPRPQPAADAGMGKEGIAALVAKLAPGTVLKGRWTFRISPESVRFLDFSTRNALTELKDRTGRFTLRIDSRDPDTLAVTATLLDSDRPGTKRPFKGEIMEERATGRAILYFPAEKETGKPPRRQVLRTDFDLWTAPENLTFQLSGEQLSGKMPGPVHPYHYWFELRCESKP